MRRLFALLLACAALAVVIAGCGGGDDNDGDGDGGSAPEAETTPAPKADDTGETNAGGPQVIMKDIKFNPATLKAKAGQTVTWTNDDSVGHDVTADDFDSGGAGNIEPGKTFTHKFAKAGTFPYVCSVHPGMKGTVKVTK
jgi:plastocyanin